MWYSDTGMVFRKDHRIANPRSTSWRITFDLLHGVICFSPYSVARRNRPTLNRAGKLANG
jgi:hypothetical protein